MLHLGIVDEQLAVVVDELDVVGVHEGEERIERVARIHPHGLADAIDTLAGLLAVGGLHLVAPERPVLLPCRRNVGFLVARFRQHVLPVLDVHRLLLQRECVVRLLLRLVVVQQRRLDRIGQERSLERRDDVADVLELALVGPLGGDLEIEHVDIHDVRRVAGVECRDSLRDPVLHRVLRQLDLDAGLGLELFDCFVQRIVFGLVEALDPPHRDLLLRRDLAGQDKRSGGA